MNHKAELVMLICAVMGCIIMMTGVSLLCEVMTNNGLTIVQQGVCLTMMYYCIALLFDR